MRLPLALRRTTCACFVINRMQSCCRLSKLTSHWETLGGAEYKGWDVYGGYRVGSSPCNHFLSVQSGLKRSGGTRFAMSRQPGSGHHATWISKVSEISQGSCCGKALSLTDRFPRPPAPWKEAWLTLALSGIVTCGSPFLHQQCRAFSECATLPGMIRSVCCRLAGRATRAHSLSSRTRKRPWTWATAWRRN